MSKSYEEWEKVNEVLGRYSFHGDLERLEGMAQHIVALEQKLQLLKDMLSNRHCDEEEIEEALSRFDN